MHCKEVSPSCHVGACSLPWPRVLPHKKKVSPRPLETLGNQTVNIVSLMGSRTT